MLAANAHDKTAGAASASWVRDAILWAAVGYLAFRCLLFARLGVALVGHPYDVDYNEGFTLNEATLLATGGKLYSDIDRPPYYVTQYTPLYPAFGAAAIRLGLSGLAACRAISLASTLGVCLLIYACSRRMGCSRLAATLAALVFPSSTYLVLWGAVAKADVSGVFWAMLGVWILTPVAAPRQRQGELCVDCTTRPWRIALAALCCAAALYTRQSLVAAPLAMGVALCVRDRRRAAQFAGVFITVSAAAFVALGLATGWEFKKHVLDYTVGIFSVERMLTSQFLFLRDHIVVVVLAALTLARAVRVRRFTPAAAYLPWALLLSLTCGRAGASSNYFLELLAVLCLCSGQAVDLVLARRPLLCLVVAAGLALQCSGVVNQYRAVDYWLRPPGPQFRQDGQRLVARLAQADGDVLCEFNGFTVRADKRVLFHLNALGDLAKRGQWDQAPLLTWIEERRFAFLAVERRDVGRWSPEAMDAIRRNYSPTELFSVYKIDKPTQLLGLVPRSEDRRDAR